ANRDGRKIDGRKRGNGQKAKRDDAGKKDRQRDQRRGNGPSDERRGEIGREMLHLISVGRFLNGIAYVKLEATRQPVKRRINNRGGVEGQQLAENQAPNNRDTERTAQFRSHTGAKRQW